MEGSSFAGSFEGLGTVSSSHASSPLRLSWHGRTLGWSETEILSLTAFGSPAKPETVTPTGDAAGLIDALRGVVRLRVAELVQKVPGHFLSHPTAGAERQKEAVEDLARYWLFVLLARHDQAGFDLLYTDGFFHGIHGPDFVVDGSGKADFGWVDRAGHVGVWSPQLLMEMGSALSGKALRRGYRRGRYFGHEAAYDFRRF